MANYSQKNKIIAPIFAVRTTKTRIQLFSLLAKIINRCR